MSDENTELAGPSEPEPKPEPLKLDAPVYDYVERGADQQGYETREVKPGEKK
jgi:hypothetical protein